MHKGVLYLARIWHMITVDGEATYSAAVVNSPDPCIALGGTKLYLKLWELPIMSMDRNWARFEPKQS